MDRAFTAPTEDASTDGVGGGVGRTLLYLMNVVRALLLFGWPTWIRPGTEVDYLYSVLYLVRNVDRLSYQELGLEYHNQMGLRMRYL